MERQVHLGRFTQIVDEAIRAGMAGPFEPATGQPLVESFEPAEATTGFEIDVLRVHDLADRGIPAKSKVAHRGAQDPHSTSGHNRHRHSTVVDDDHVDAFLFAAVQPLSPHGPGDIGGNARVASADLPVADVNVLPHARKDVSDARCCFLSVRCENGQRREHRCEAMAIAHAT